MHALVDVDSFASTLYACPCASGFTHATCCGVAAHASRSVVGVVDETGLLHAASSTTPELHNAVNNVATSPDLFPVTIDFFSGTARLIKMSPEWYARSVFLDPLRIPGRCALDVSLAWLNRATQHLPWKPTPLIFHTAFSGSTLLSKILATNYDSLPLREPEVFANLMVFSQARNHSSAQIENHLNEIFSLLGRSYRAQQRSVIKTNDYVCVMMPALVAWREANRSLFMYTPFREFAAACLKDETRHAWIRDRFAFIRDEAGRLLNLPATFTLAADEHLKMAAVYWSYNIAQYLDTYRKFPDRLRSLDFNMLLEQPLETVAACGTWFALQAYGGIDTEHNCHLLLQQYSKDDNYAYSPARRRRDIETVLAVNHHALAEAEGLARELLGVDYPWFALPGSVVKKTARSPAV